MGNKSSSTGSQQSAPSTDTLKDTAPTSNFEPPKFQVQDVSEIIQNASIPDPSQLHPLAGLGQTSLDYLTLDESTLSDLPGAQTGLPSRGWSDDLCYGTGITYVTALGLGGAWGLAEGLNRAPASAPPKLRLNSVLNSITRRGPFLGNSAGVIALGYNLVNSTIGYYRGKHDALNSITSGALSGMLFKSTRGLRPMMVSGALAAGAAGTWTVCFVAFKIVN
jgi:mitochondrial import inner membrane translocase subunit TIM23